MSRNSFFLFGLEASVYFHYVFSSLDSWLDMHQLRSSPVRFYSALLSEFLKKENLERKRQHSETGRIQQMTKKIGKQF